MKKLGSFMKFLFKAVKFILNFLTLLIILIITVAIMGYVYLSPKFESARVDMYDKLASINDYSFRMNSDTEIYDNGGNLIGVVSAGHYEYVPISEISKTLQDGYISIEDRRFKEHFGIDFKGNLRAVYLFIKSKGEIRQGGSSITQQVIKNNLLTQERTLDRKLVEVMLAPYIDTRYGKDKIMEFYCNTNYYGHRNYGVYSASRYYFGKEPKDLDYSESALLIALSNNPSKYDPIVNPDSALEKRNSNLDEMFSQGLFDEGSLNTYKSKELNIVQNYQESTKENYQISYSIHCAALELMKLDGFEFRYTFEDKTDYDTYKESYSLAYSEKSDSIRGGGYKIYTTLDSNKQSSLQDILDRNLSSFTEIDTTTSRLALQGALVAVDNNTNHVVAIIGGRGTEDEFNRGYLSYRQPGSVIKPLLDYAPAFETGEYYPSKLMNDYKFDNGPDNSGGYYGYVSLREALNRSLNTVAWQLLENISNKVGLSYLGKLKFVGISYIDNTVPAISLGGFTRGLRIVDIAKGYSTLANLGVYSDKTCIKSISFNDTDIALHQESKYQVYSPDTVFMITDVLRGTLNEQFGTGKGLGIDGYDLAGKTGTTNEGKDTWFSGYSKDYTVSVWVGYDTPREMPGVYGATYAGKIWQDSMVYLLDGVEDKPFINYKPESVYLASYDSKGDEIYGSISDSLERLSGTDYFSSKAKENLDILNRKRLDEVRYNKALKMLEGFEGFYISTVEDTQLYNDIYKEVLASISAIENTENRNSLLERLNNKLTELDGTTLAWKEQIDDYLANQEILRQQEKESRLAQEEQDRLELDKTNRIQAFDLKMVEIENLKYRSDEHNNIWADAKTSLDNLIGLDEYTGRANKYMENLDKYNNLPDKIEYEKQLELERTLKEESISSDVRDVESAISDILNEQQ